MGTASGAGVQVQPPLDGGRGGGKLRHGRRWSDRTERRATDCNKIAAAGGASPSGAAPVITSPSPGTPSPGPPATTAPADAGPAGGAPTPTGVIAERRHLCVEARRRRLGG